MSFILAATTTTTGKSTSGGIPFFLILLVLFAVLYFVMIRPRQRRASAQRQQLSDLRVGDEILTAGGVYGTVKRLDDDELTMEIAPSVTVRVARRAVAAIVTEHVDDDGAEEQEKDDGDRWQSAFDHEAGGGSGGDRPG